MKTFITICALVASLNSFASEAIVSVMSQTEVEKLTAEKREAGLLLSKVEDVYAASGVRPRCPCESMKFTYTKNTVKNGKPVRKVEVYSVMTSGFGTNVNVSINEEK